MGTATKSLICSRKHSLLPSCLLTCFSSGKSTFSVCVKPHNRTGRGPLLGPVPRHPGAPARPRQSRQREAGRAAYLGLPQRGRTLMDPRDALPTPRRRLSGVERSRRTRASKSPRHTAAEPEGTLGGGTRRGQPWTARDSPKPRSAPPSPPLFESSRGRR